MSLPLKDIRSKVPVETFAMIKGHAVASRRDESEVIRDILTEWAERMSHAASVAQGVLRVEGIGGNGRG